jgi:hypothetical protein
MLLELCLDPIQCNCGRDFGGLIDVEHNWPDAGDDDNLQSALGVYFAASNHRSGRRLHGAGPNNISSEDLAAGADVLPGIP